MRPLILFCIFLLQTLQSETLSTFYGPLEIEEPVILELIDSLPFQRLQTIHQYGVSYYTQTHPENYTRFDHSLGVFALLRAQNAPLTEQIAGLLHDVSHTAFSHVGDWVFHHDQKEEDYQTTTHNRYLSHSGIETILNRHGYTVEEVHPQRAPFVLLEQPLPHLSADRLDYNLQGAYYQNFLTKEEVQLLFDTLYVEAGHWVIPNLPLAKKLAAFSLFMTQDCWGSPFNIVTSNWLAEAIRKAIDAKLIETQDFIYGTDDTIWELLTQSTNPAVTAWMEKLYAPDHHFQTTDPKDATHFLPFKCRAIDPLVEAQGIIAPLSVHDPAWKISLQTLRELSKQGWPVKLLDDDEEACMFEIYRITPQE